MLFLKEEVTGIQADWIVLVFTVMTTRLMAENAPLGNFADISYLEVNFKLR